jgi:hypothetical protein
MSRERKKPQMVSRRIKLPCVLVVAAVFLTGCSFQDPSNGSYLTVENDTAQVRGVGVCSDYTCDRKKARFRDVLAPGGRKREWLAADGSTANPLLVTDAGGRVIGCIFVAVPKDSRNPTISLSREKPCRDKRVQQP